MPIRPYSIAVRVLHSARYGADGSDPRLLSSFLGSSYFVRGHREDLRYCRPDATRVCGDDLLGSRRARRQPRSARAALGHPLAADRLRHVPADAFVFADGGMVWSGARRATGISSLGGGVRVNAGGLPFEMAAIRALDGPRPRWQFDFGFRIGF